MLCNMYNVCMFQNLQLVRFNLSGAIPIVYVLNRMMEIRWTQLHRNILYLFYSFNQPTCFDPLKGSSSGHRNIYKSHMVNHMPNRTYPFTCSFEIKNIIYYFSLYNKFHSIFIVSLICATKMKLCVFDWMMCWSCNLVSCIAEMSRLYRINWYVSIISEPILNNVLTFHDPVNLPVPQHLIHRNFCEFIWGFSWIFSTPPFVMEWGWWHRLQPSSIFWTWDQLGINSWGFRQDFWK
jgi:hypothetical protein